MHGGTVTAQSEGEGKGSIFSVTLPVSAGREEPTETLAVQPGYRSPRGVCWW